MDSTSRAIGVGKWPTLGLDLAKLFSTAIVSVAMISGCTKPAPEATSAAGVPTCTRPTDLVLTEGDFKAAVSGLGKIASGNVEAKAIPSVSKVLTDPQRSALVVDYLVCVAEKRGELDPSDTARVDSTRLLFLYMWGTSPTPSPAEVAQFRGALGQSVKEQSQLKDNSTTIPTFPGEAFANVQPNTDTCTKQVIPARTPVCVNMHGSWANGLGPLGVRDPGDRRGVGSGSMSVYAKAAHLQETILVSPRPYEHSSWFLQNVDYVICVRPPESVSVNPRVQDQMSVDVSPMPRDECSTLAERDRAAVTGSTIDAVAIQPNPDILLQKNQTVNMQVKVGFTLASDQGEIAVVVNDQANHQLAQQAHPVSKGHGSESFTLIFAVPADAKSLTVFIPLTEAGQRQQNVLRTKFFNVK